VLQQLGAKIGDKIKIGAAEFPILDTVEEDTGQSRGGSAGLAPRAYISRTDINKTQLIVKKGSTLFYTTLIRLPKTQSNEDLAERLRDVLTDPALRIFTHQASGERTARFMNYLTDYLGLVAIIALFLAALGATYLLRGFMRSRLKEMAILQFLGLTPQRISRLFLWELLTLSALAALVSIVVAYSLLPLFRWVIRDLTTFQIDLTFSPWAGLLGLGVSGALVVLIAWPFLARLKSTSPGIVFQEGAEPLFRWSFWDALRYAPLILFFWLLAIFQAHSLQVGSLFVSGLILSFVVLGLLGLALLRIAHSLRERRPLWLRLSLLHLSRKPLPSLTTFAAISLGVLLVNLISQLEGGLRKELEPSSDSPLPNLFLVDIQEEQLSPLKKHLKEAGFKLNWVSPMIRARLLQVNDQDFEFKSAGDRYLTREQEREAQFRNRGFNLSYRDGLAPSEEIVRGRPMDSFNPSSGQPPQISVEKRFAGRFGWKIGDTLNFDIQGVEVSAQIVNLRKVRWSSFQPNFFIQFQPGVIDAAPKTFIGILSNLNRDESVKAQSLIVSKFANISVVDVDRTVERLLGVLNQINWALRFMAYLVLAAGAFVLFTIGWSQAHERKQEIDLLKMLGLPWSTLQSTLRSEFFLLSFFASILGVALSLALSLVLSFFVFDRLWEPQWITPLASLVFVTLFSLFVASYSLKSPKEI
jgi:putative ABC transport system permease protein